MDNNANMASRYEHEIPEGYEARIEGNKVIIELESEDERIRREIIADIQVHHPNWMAYKDYTSWINWLKRQVEPKTSEWSEYDNAKIEFLCNLIKRNISEGTYSFGDGAKNGFVSKQEAIKMLQSLKPQSQWKPTKQQLEAIRQVAEQNRASEIGNILDNLLVEIKNM